MPRPPVPAGPGQTYAQFAGSLQSFSRRVSTDEDPERREWRRNVIERCNELIELINEDTKRVINKSSPSSRRAG